MTEFLTQLLTLPALPWTVAMGVTVLYWLLVIFGAVGLDMLGGGAESVAGGVKGAGEALSGSLKGAGDALSGSLKGAGDALSGSLKGAGDALSGSLKGAGDALSGSLKGAGEALSGGVKGAGEAIGGALKGAGEVAADAAGDAASGLKGAADAAKSSAEAVQGGVFHALGLGKVPVTISFSFISFFGWLLSMLGAPLLSGAGLPLRLGATVVSLIAAVLAAAVVVRPLGRVFESPAPARRTDIIGKLAEVTSGKVDASFGTGLVDDGGAGLNVHLVCSKQNSIKKGDRVLVLDYDPKSDAYDVEPLDWLEPLEVEALKDPARAAEVLASRVRVK